MTLLKPAFGVWSKYHGRWSPTVQGGRLAPLKVGWVWLAKLDDHLVAGPYLRKSGLKTGQVKAEFKELRRLCAKARSGDNIVKLLKRYPIRSINLRYSSYFVVYLRDMPSSLEFYSYRAFDGEHGFDPIYFTGSEDVFITEMSGDEIKLSNGRVFTMKSGRAYPTLAFSR